MSDDLGWTGTKVRNADGREGVISHELSGFLFRSLTLSMPDGTEDQVQLSADGKDSGAADWEWYCENFDGGPRWLALGNQNKRIEA